MNIVAAIYAMIILLFSACSPPPPPATLKGWDVVGDSTLFVANDRDPIPGARSFPGSSPHDGAPSTKSSPQIMWVYAGTNIGGGQPGPSDDVWSMIAACGGKRCKVVLQGVSPEYDAAVLRTQLPVCDLRPLHINRPDGTHPDDAGDVTMSEGIKACMR